MTDEDATTPPTEAQRTDEEALVAGAARGERAAFDELYRRHAGAAWSLAVTVTGDVEESLAALADGFAAAFTAIGAGRTETGAPFRVHLLTRTRNAALDRMRERQGDLPATPPPPAPDPLLEDTFRSLPERWRSILWLRVVDGVELGPASAVVGLDTETGAKVDTRAHRGLLQRYSRVHAATHGAGNCHRAVARLGAEASGTLAADDRHKLERHLDLCGSCTALRERLASLEPELHLLAPPLPERAHDRVARTWLVAVATHAPSSGRLSPRAEKILAGVSAVAAAVAIFGAAIAGVSDSDDHGSLAAPTVAPLISEAASPAPFDPTGGMTVPTPSSQGLTASDIAEAAAEAEDALADPGPVPGSPDPVAATAPDEPTSLDDPTEQETLPDEVDGLVPDAEIGTEVGGVPIAVDVDEDPGLTAGPVSVGSEPEPNDEPVQVEESSEIEDQATEPLPDEPAIDEPVPDDPATDDTVDTEVVEPVTDTIESTGDTVGL